MSMLPYKRNGKVEKIGYCKKNFRNQLNEEKQNKKSMITPRQQYWLNLEEQEDEDNGED